MSFKIGFLKNIFIAGGYTYLLQIVTFGSSLITARLLLPENFGLVGLITVFSGFITIFSDSGISMAVVRSSYGWTYHQGLNNIALILGILLCIISLLLIYPISIFYSNDNLIKPGIAISFLFIVRSINIVPTAILQKNLDFAFIGKANLFAAIVSVVATIFFAFGGFEHWSLIWPQFLSALAIHLVIRTKVTLPLSLAPPAVIAKCFSVTKNLIGSILGFNLVNYWARNADSLIVGKVYGPSDLGIYNRGYSLLALPLSLISGVFSSVLYPSLTQLEKQGKDVYTQYYFALKIISFLNLPIALLLILAPDSFVNLLWGKNWSYVARLLPYFGVLILTQSILSTVGSILVLKGQERAMMISGWIGAFIMVTAIAIGSRISLVAIAAYYSFSYIAGVLTFNVIYIFGHILGASFSTIARFWIPKIFLSMLIWAAIFFKYHNLLIVGVLLWVLLIVLDSWSELKQALRYFLLSLKRA